MSSEELNQEDLSEEQALQEHKLVPIAESIRYRKRAQLAEKKAADLESQLQQAHGRNESLESELGTAKTENSLVQKLAASGANDLEAAVLMAKTRLAKSDKPDVDTVIEQLRKEKAYLFAEPLPACGSKTSGVREKLPQFGRLEKAAKTAAATGSRLSVHEYMKIKRCSGSKI